VVALGDQQAVQLHAGFLDALAALDSRDQKRVRSMIGQLSEGEETKGARRHNVGDFVSLSASMDLRVIATSDSNGLVLLHTDHHDEAYRWAKRHSNVLSDQGSLLAVLPVQSRTGTAGPHRSETSHPSRFAALPRPVADLLDGIEDESELIETIAALSPEWQEVALAASLHEIEAGPPSDIVTVDDELLEYALRLPEDRWRVFLHPRQRFVVDAPLDGHLLVKGGPGTGKTICLIHRFVRLCSDSTKPQPLLVGLSPAAEQAMEEACRTLGHSPDPQLLWAVQDLPSSRDELEKHFARHSSILIDEGQDLPVHLVRNILELLERESPIPPLYIAFDSNQAIVQPSGDALGRLVEFCDVVTLRYCYRSTDQIVAKAGDLLDRFHHDYNGGNHEHSHHIAACRDASTAETITALLGPEVVVTETPIISMPEKIVEVCTELRERQDGTVAVILVSESPENFRNMKTKLVELDPDLTVLSSRQCKGLEFRHGVVVDLMLHDFDPDRISHSRYQLLSCLYVAVTRFRNSVTCLATIGSPLLPDHP
jgi:hypothetical protein